jgi:hypothetical protein
MRVQNTYGCDPSQARTPVLQGLSTILARAPAADRRPVDCCERLHGDRVEFSRKYRDAISGFSV